VAFALPSASATADLGEEISQCHHRSKHKGRKEVKPKPTSHSKCLSHAHPTSFSGQTSLSGAYTRPLTEISIHCSEKPPNKMHSTWALAVLPLVSALYQNGSVIAPCDSPLYCQGEILREIELARPFEDSKLYVDL
jgi:hypothetical protein